MNYLLDTHALLWYLFDDEHLSETAREIITNETAVYSMHSICIYGTYFAGAGLYGCIKRSKKSS